MGSSALACIQARPAPTGGGVKDDGIRLCQQPVPPDPPRPMTFHHLLWLHKNTPTLFTSEAENPTR